MKLDYSSFDINWIGFDSSYEDTFERNRYIEKAKAEYALSEVKLRLEKAENKQKEIDNLTYEKSLIMSNAVDIIKEDISESHYNIFRFLNMGDCLHKAWKYSYLKNEGRLVELPEESENDESRDDYQRDYDFVVTMIKRRLISDKYRDRCELIEIVNYNYSVAYEFTFRTKDDIEFTIWMPVFLNADINNYREMLSGYALYFNSSEYVIDCAFRELDTDVYSQKLEEWLDNQIKEKETIVYDYSQKKEDN